MCAYWGRVGRGLCSLYGGRHFTHTPTYPHLFHIPTLTSTLLTISHSLTTFAHHDTPTQNIFQIKFIWDIFIVHLPPRACAQGGFLFGGGSLTALVSGEFVECCCSCAATQDMGSAVVVVLVLLCVSLVVCCLLLLLLFVCLTLLVGKWYAMPIHACTIGSKSKNKWYALIYPTHNNHML